MKKTIILDDEERDIDERGPFPTPIKGSKPAATIKGSRVTGNKGKKGRVEAISPDPKAHNLPGRLTPKGQKIASEDFDNTSERGMQGTLNQATRSVLKKVNKAKHNVRFSPRDPMVWDPSMHYPEEEDLYDD